MCVCFSKLLPVNGEAIRSMIVDVNKHGVSPVNPNFRAWITIIHHQHRLCGAQPCKVGLSDLPLIKKITPKCLKKEANVVRYEIQLLTMKS